MARADRKGRSTNGGRFVALHHFLMATDAWKSLSPQMRCVYVAVVALYNGGNNGFLALGVRDAATSANVNKDTAGKCFAALVERGFLECATPGGFSRKVRHATEWRLTAYKCNKTGALPSKAFVTWEPPPLARMYMCPKVGDRPSSAEAAHGPKPGDRNGPRAA